MGTELAKAYVQIVPSAHGIKGSITQALGGEADSAGIAAGQSFGGKMMSTLKNVIIAAGIGKALTSTILEGAALEQSLGGIETLFKKNADQLKQYANEAYRTAGLSANDYMETVTSFSASLLQGLAGDTAKAADISDMAITDMADNSNKMGTSMELIQNAYQGFAKQNYTMLDNLKLGYGGTKTEMDRLLADAQKISGVKYDIGNLSDVYSAIHVIQGELNITGTTAKEAASTLSGSFASMKAVFKDVLGKMTLGEDIMPTLQALVSTTKTFLVGNLLPAIRNVVSSFATIVIDSAPQLWQAGMDLINNLASGVAASIPVFLAQALPMILQFSETLRAKAGEMVSAGLNLITQVVQGLINGLPALIAYVPTIVTNIAGIINDNFPKILQTGVQLVGMLISGIIQNIPNLIANAGEIVKAIFSVVMAVNWVGLGKTLLTGIINGIKALSNMTISSTKEIFVNALNAVKNINWLDLGKNILLGIVNGIKAMPGIVTDALLNIMSSAVDAVKRFFGIKSPSRLMRDEIGKFIPAGIAVGIEKNTKPISNAMRNLTDLTTSTLQTDLAVQLSKSNALAVPAYDTLRGAGSEGMVFHQTIYSHDSLSPYEMSRAAEDMLSQEGWKIK